MAKLVCISWLDKGKPYLSMKTDIVGIHWKCLQVNSSRTCHISYSEISHCEIKSHRIFHKEGSSHKKIQFSLIFQTILQQILWRNKHKSRTALVFTNFLHAKKDFRPYVGSSKVISKRISQNIVKFPLTYCSRETRKRVIGKQCRPRSDTAECGIWSGSPMFANSLAIFL